MRRIRLGNLILVFGIAMAAIATAARSVDSPAEIGHLAVKNIDEHYLYALDPAWKKVRAEIASATAPDRAAMYVLIRQHLADLRDSELHLVAPPELASIQRESKGTIMGTGVMEFSVDVVPDTGEARIVTPLVGSPAAIAGLRPRDVIVAVNGKPTRDLDHEQVLDDLRSPGGTDLLIRRGNRKFRVRLLRSDAPLHSVTAKLLPTQNGTVAYMRILQFTPDTADAVRSAITKFEAEHPRGYILDLRNNPGGFLDAATHLCGFFVSGPLGYKVRRSGDAEPIMADGTPLTKAPVVVVVNEGTASAAEMVAGALQGRHRAMIVGARTYGRGQAQVYEALVDGYGLVVPSALIRTPDGRLFKGTGLAPDVTVMSAPVVEAEINVAGDRQLLRAIALVSKGQNTRPHGNEAARPQS